MKTTIRIAKLELNSLFYSPIAWFLLIIFLFQCGLEYTTNIEGWVTIQEIGTNLRSLNSLTEKIFAPPFGILPAIMSKLYLYLPLLTMGLMSREISSGTIKLLFSSPVKVRAIIFGKFMAMMVYNLLLVLILGIIVLVAFFNMQHIDYGMLLSALLGIYLLLCAYAAIGLFMSCLTSYQVVAAVSTLVIFAVLNYIGTLWQSIDFVRDLTYFLSISGRAEKMVVGLISTKDVLYFIIIIYIFLSLSIYKIQSGRESGGRLFKFLRYTFVIASGLIIGYISSRPVLVGYYDATANKTRTLTPPTQKIINDMKGEPLEVVSYINILDNLYWYGKPEDRNMDISRWEPYLRFKPEIKFRYVYYYNKSNNERIFKTNPGLSVKQIAEKFAKSFKEDISLFKSPEEISKEVNLEPEEFRYVMQLKYKGKTTFLRLFDDNVVFPGETETSAALKRLTTTMPRIAFLQGEHERTINKKGDKDYQFLTNFISFRRSLINQGFDVDTVSLKNKEIPKGIEALVIADPKVDFAPEVLAKIQKYIEEGGNLLIAGEPGRQSILNPLIQPLGVQLMDGILIQKSQDFAPDLLQLSTTENAATFTNSLKRSHEDSFKVSMPGAAGLIYNRVGAFDIKPLLLTDDTATWNKKGALTLDSAAIKYEPQNGDTMQAIPTALGLSRRINGKQQRIIITGDADFISNSELGRRNIRTSNFTLATAMFSWLSNGQFPIDTTRPQSKDNRFNLSVNGLRWLKIFLIGILPGILLIIGSVLLIRRKKR